MVFIKVKLTFLVSSRLVLILQGKFSVKPSMFVTAKHHNPGLKSDAASVWVEDITQSSCKICMRELQNYAGSHRDVLVVSNVKQNLCTCVGFVSSTYAFVRCSLNASYCFFALCSVSLLSLLNMQVFFYYFSALFNLV